ncbi:hypothetical protein [Pseudobacteriovorax antillogorgiicola]|uniref:Uncharacterized protein n=1 Tax=Pseudobacteriovorax antillogorgiicola TaxID=1513793 RepID=A0A1Y6BQN4_9BACT|nr:hypothetical protein [Pseudobacteriovorax antillogorgiicola]TCS54718.1 hypothetical protein EDD56_106231 [Pseudobacteriovorax antillogorgiicola]SMF16049.1 hypothetical protein SAMN06296036_10612 [Pseudobacteriovorax antillogorgiicola]
MIRSLLIGISLLTASQSYGNVIFDASQSCIKASSNPERYRPPCHFEPRSLMPSFMDQIPEDLRAAPFQSIAKLSFSCESLRPFSANYTLNDGQEVVGEGHLAASHGATTRLTFLHQYGQAGLRIAGLKGTQGFQAFKPACQLVVDRLVSLPEPKYFQLLAESLLKLDRTLGMVFAMATPDQSYAEALQVLDQASLLLEFLQFSADELTSMQIAQTLIDLGGAKEVLNQDCGASSQVSLRTAAIRETRDLIQSKVMEADSAMTELKDFLARQIDWLKDHASQIAENEIGSLEMTLDRIK